MLDDIRGKRVLVTGASSGIGEAGAVAFAAHGATVAIHYNAKRAEAEALRDRIVADGGTAELVAGDLSDPANGARVAEDAAEALGGLDVLINNAGAMVKPVKLAEYDDEIFGRVFDLNVRSVLVLTRGALPFLKASGGGAIINVGSIAGRNGGLPGSALYAASKSAIHSVTRAMANEFGPFGIRANAIAPGIILTPFHAKSDPDRLETARKSLPLERLGVPEDCAGAFLYLASNAMSGYVTGAIIDINGGRLMP